MRAQEARHSVKIDDRESTFKVVMVLAALLTGIALLFGVGLLYFVFIGVRAIYRSTYKVAREVGHASLAASMRAVVRMAVWAAFFGVFYTFLYVLGRSVGWWALIPGVVGCVAMIHGMLQADRLLTLPRGAMRPLMRVALTIAALLATLASVTWFAAASAP